jgi:hypothetical protein
MVFQRSLSAHYLAGAGQLAAAGSMSDFRQLWSARAGIVEE